MNLKNVLKTYSLLRSLSDNESALLETLRSLNDSEREQLVETMAPVKAVTKKPRKKREAKSAHQQSLSSAIQRVPKSLDGGVSKTRCAAEGCGEYVDNPVHDSLMGYVGYHEFDSGQALAASGD